MLANHNISSLIWLIHDQFARKQISRISFLLWSGKQGEIWMPFKGTWREAQVNVMEIVRRIMGSVESFIHVVSTSDLFRWGQNEGSFIQFTTTNVNRVFVYFINGCERKLILMKRVKLRINKLGLGSYVLDLRGGSDSSSSSSSASSWDCGRFEAKIWCESGRNIASSAREMR